MFESLVDQLTGTDWAYALVFAIAVLDAVFPVVPSETALITAAAIAMTGDLSLTAVAASGAAGAALGDNAAYAIGRFSSRLTARVSRRGRWGSRLHTAGEALQRRTGTIVVVSRFVPGGRTATMIAAGLTHVPWLRFVRADLAGAVLWAVYGAGLGALGGLAFRDRPLVAVAIGLALALAVAGLAELVRRLRDRGKAARREGKGRIRGSGPSS